MGIRYLADPAHQLPMLNAVAAPDGLDEAVVRKRLLAEHAIEIGGGRSVQGQGLADRPDGRERHAPPRGRGSRRAPLRPFLNQPLKAALQSVERVAELAARGRSVGLNVTIAQKETCRRHVSTGEEP